MTSVAEQSLFSDLDFAKLALDELMKQVSAVEQDFYNIDTIFIDGA